MKAIRDAAILLEITEAKLRDLIKDSLGCGAYEDVAKIASIANAISELRRGLLGQPDSGNEVPKSVPQHTGAKGVAEILAVVENRLQTADAQRKVDEKTEFPRFERHAKRLVKLGWSAKDKRIYEQRAPYEVVEEIFERFVEKAGSKRVLRIEKLLPMKTSTGDEIPSYQVYLVLKWLQRHSVVERQGKDGYLLGQTDVDVKSLWDATPAR